MGADKPQISIGLPVFNGEEYLVQTIESVLSQTYEDLELVISDNASSDDTQTICQSFATRDNRIKYYRNDINLGAAPNFNRVFKLSSGKYFKWMAYDDIIAPEFISKCVLVLEQNPDVVLCFPKSKIIDKNGEILGDHKYKSDTSSSEPHIRFRNLVLTPDTGWQVFGLMRTNMLEKTSLHGSYPASDLVLLAEIALYGKFVEIPEFLLFPRHHPAQATNLIPVERNRVSFYNTSLKDKILLPKWLYLLGYIKAVHNAPLNVNQRSYCYLQLVRWVFIPDHFRALGKDVLIAGHKFAHQVLA